ncbi:hypothetical protein CALVIDRAFT_59389 [Calocera viscosa TUFC12733]|uniref:Uncharacterized protein n=1 Tax=Calocera viscosa (strain TUFC12733) TaxID=1330018 RepID=A0A167NID7_CALVF|nr:hypothetical protein CALVIDRAFT_59389 [Calocera viscosa TUFC12733]
MATTQTPINIETEHEPTYEAFAQTGEVSPTVVQNEENSMRRLEGPVVKQVSIDDYDDKHVRVCATKRTLTIKHWLLTPAPKSGVSAWGTGITGVGWARDFRRMFPTGKAFDHSYVVKYRNPFLGIRAGFTVQDPERFLYTIEKLEPAIHTKVLPDVTEYVGIKPPVEHKEEPQAE